MNGETRMRKVLLRALWATLGGLLSFGAVSGRAALTENLVLQVAITDRYSPEAVPDLGAAATVTAGQVLLTWTAPDEDNRVFVSPGKVSSYLMK